MINTGLLIPSSQFCNALGDVEIVVFSRCLLIITDDAFSASSQKIFNIGNPTQSSTRSNITQASRGRASVNMPPLLTFSSQFFPHLLSFFPRTHSRRRETNRGTVNGRRMTKAPKKKAGGHRLSIPNAADRGFSTNRINSLSSVIATSTGLLSNVPYSSPGSSNVFGIGSEHPFANYWTCEGGLPEVISVLPDKLQADILLGRYFECVDPVYPMLHRQTFYADYEHFWSMSPADKDHTDAAFVALIFVMLALGTQFVTSTSPRERKQTAEFYASASNQALRMSSYLSSASLKSIQAMVLITYFLINDNHASDGWAFGGILMRQAYAMGLHRDPNIGRSNAFFAAGWRLSSC